MITPPHLSRSLLQNRGDAMIAGDRGVQEVQSTEIPAHAVRR
jgi:hypothetical protein